MTTYEDLFSEVSDLMDKKKDLYKEYDKDTGKTADEIGDAIDDVKRQVKSQMNSNGFEKIPGGTYRNVYGNQNIVVKFASGRLGTDENAAEIRNCTRISKTNIKDVFDVTDEAYCKGDTYISSVESYETGANRWLVMDRVDDGPNTVSTEEARRLDEALENEGIHIAEIGPASMGLQDGVPVIFDYAGT